MKLSETVLAQELYEYDIGKHPSKIKPEWVSIPFWKQLRYKAQAERIIQTLKTIQGKETSE